MDRFVSIKYYFKIEYIKYDINQQIVLYIYKVNIYLFINMNKCM